MTFDEILAQDLARGTPGTAESVGANLIAYYTDARNFGGSLPIIPYSGGTSLTTNGYTPPKSLTGTSIFNWPWDKDNGILSPSGIFGSDIVGYAALAYGGYRLIGKRKRDIMTLAMVAYGLWATGLLGQLLPRNSDGKVDLKTIALTAVSPTLGMASMVGISAVALPLIIGLFKKKSSYRRRRYARPYRTSYRRRSYRRRY